MYENYTRQSLPSKKYRELLGSAICVFNSNNSFIVENILHTDQFNEFDWHTQIDKVSGRLLPDVEKTITANSNSEIAELFRTLIATRNRIIHSFQITAPAGKTDDPDNQMLATKYKDGRQELITEKFLLEFIKKNQELSSMLYGYRDSVRMQQAGDVTPPVLPTSPT